jgi:hypothetical protein
MAPLVLLSIAARVHKFVEAADLPVVCSPNFGIAFTPFINTCGAGGVRVTDEASMIPSSFHTTILAGALACAGIVGPAATALARTSYDGTWSVLIVTRSGECERALRYEVQIENGNVFADGGSASLQGRVAPSGAVRVSVSSGNQRAEGSGRLSRDTGGGQWRGQGSEGFCAGTWRADRRG